MSASNFLFLLLLLLVILLLTVSRLKVVRVYATRTLDLIARVRIAFLYSRAGR